MVQGGGSPRIYAGEGALQRSGKCCGLRSCALAPAIPTALGALSRSWRLDQIYTRAHCDLHISSHTGAAFPQRMLRFAAFPVPEPNLLSRYIGGCQEIRGAPDLLTHFAQHVFGNAPRPSILHIDATERVFCFNFTAQRTPMAPVAALCPVLLPSFSDASAADQARRHALTRRTNDARPGCAGRPRSKSRRIFGHHQRDRGGPEWKLCFPRPRQTPARRAHRATGSSIGQRRALYFRRASLRVPFDSPSAQ